MIEITAQAQDDPEFVDLVRAIVHGAAREHEPRDVFIVAIDNWFGRNWLGFSHKHLGSVGLHMTKGDYVVPSFVPARVLSERAFECGADGEYRAVGVRQPIHIRQMGSMNRYRRAWREFSDAMLFWWSSRSDANGKGALMCYYPTRSGHEGWYAGFERGDGWRVRETRSIPAELLSRYAAAGRAADATPEQRAASRDDA